MTFSDKDIYRELINRKPKKAKDLPDPEQHAILGFANADGAVEVYLRNESGEVRQLPDDLIVLIHLNRETASKVHESTGDPSEWPTTL